MFSHILGFLLVELNGLFETELDVFVVGEGDAAFTGITCQFSESKRF
jgi:hypothetical protein